MPQKMALQGLVNTLVRGLSRVPGLSGRIGARLITLYVVGRKSGKRYTIPVAYTRYQGVLLVGSGFAWGRNLSTGDQLEVSLAGRRRTADVEVVADEAGVVEHYAVITRDNPSFAKFNEVRLTPQGEPEPADLHAAWAAGGRVFRLTLR
jgi:hypothetical protein